MNYGNPDSLLGTYIVKDFDGDVKKLFADATATPLKTSEMDGNLHHRLPQEQALDSTAAPLSDFSEVSTSSISKDMNGVKKNNSIDESKWLRTRFFTDDTEIYVREMEKVLGVDRKNSAYLAEQLSHGRIDSRTDEALQDLMKIKKKMQGFAQKNNISIEDLSTRFSMWSASQTPKAKEQGMMVPKLSEEEMQIMLDFGEYADETTQYLRQNGYINEFGAIQRGQKEADLMGATPFENLAMQRIQAIALVEKKGLDKHSLLCLSFNIVRKYVKQVLQAFLNFGKEI